MNGYRWPCKDPDNVMPEAYEGEGNCVVRQLCAMYGLEREDVEEEFNAIGDWTEGITFRQAPPHLRTSPVKGPCIHAHTHEHIACVWSDTLCHTGLA